MKNVIESIILGIILVVFGLMIYFNYLPIQMLVGIIVVAFGIVAPIHVTGGYVYSKICERRHMTEGDV